MLIPIGKALKHFCMLKESLTLCKHGNILLFLSLFKNAFAVYISECLLWYMIFIAIYSDAGYHVMAYVQT